jgi:hypothetical protein
MQASQAQIVVSVARGRVCQRVLGDKVQSGMLLDLCCGIGEVSLMPKQDAFNPALDINPLVLKNLDSMYKSFPYSG